MLLAARARRLASERRARPAPAALAVRSLRWRARAARSPANSGSQFDAFVERSRAQRV